jgi:hypothetical protein
MQCLLPRNPFTYHLTDVAVNRNPIGWKGRDIKARPPLIVKLNQNCQFSILKGEQKGDCEFCFSGIANES